MKNIILIILAMAVAAGCGKEPQPMKPLPDHPLLKTLKTPPPLNKPSGHALAAKEATRVLAKEDASIVLMLQDNKMLSGDLRYQGTIEMTNESIRFQDKKGAGMQILYRLPKELGDISPVSEPVELYLRDRSGPAGAQQRMVLSKKQRLLLGQTWERSASPLNVSFAGNLALRQKAVASPKAGYTEAQVSLFEKDRALAVIPVGKPTQVQTASGPVVVLVEISQYFQPTSKDKDQYPAQYILKAWIREGAGK